MEGATEVPEGFTWRNVLGSYVHLHFGSCPQLASSLVDCCRQVDLAALNAAVGAAQKQVASMLHTFTGNQVLSEQCAGIHIMFSKQWSCVSPPDRGSPALARLFSHQNDSVSLC